MKPNSYAIFARSGDGPALESFVATHMFALGGLGRIGMNCLALEYERKWMLVDCGMRMGSSELGIGIVEPDLRWFCEQPGEFLGVVLTHGHEDHLGALPRLLQTRPAPVWAPPYALAYFKAKLTDNPLETEPELRELPVGESLQLGPFRVRSIRVTHSTADATSLLIETPDGRLLHTGDFKLDPHPVDNMHYDEEAFEAIGRDGLDLLLSDSTNAMNEGNSTSESALYNPLLEIVEQTKGRVMISIFASNTHRLRTIFTIAEQTQRRVCLLGRSVRRHVDTAQQTGHLPRVDRLLVRPKEARHLKRHQILFIATGSQGEGNAALARVFRDEHRIELGAGDTLVLSARVIPGNEKRVFRMLSGFAERGLDVYFPPYTKDIHASGHAYREELRWMLRTTQPREFVPIHGTRLHLNAHARLAHEEGVSSTHILSNGESLILSNGAVERGDDFEWDEVFRSPASHALDRQTIRERNHIARNGVCVVSGVTGDLQVQETGTGASDEHLDALEELLCALDSSEVEEELITRMVRRFYKAALGSRPEVLVAVYLP